MADRAFEGNQFDNPQLNHVMPVANISYQAELMESFSSYESGMRLYRLFVRYLRDSPGRSLVADEKAALVTLARNASTHIQRADTFLELSNELVQLAQQLRRFLKKNFLIQDVGAGLIKMLYLGNAGWRFNRFSTACIAAFPSEIPFW